MVEVTLSYFWRYVLERLCPLGKGALLHFFQHVKKPRTKDYVNKDAQTPSHAI
jgi:hypothetical protein